MKKLSVLLAALLMVGAASSGAEGFAFTTTPAFKPASGASRTLVIISDLHLGPGKRADGTWYRTEDFRWPKAFQGFLEEISKQGNDKVDLLIAGDLLDMWQPPPHLNCEGPSPDLGCTPAEMKAVAAWIVQAHPQEFASLRAFTRRGENRLHLIPGNHDAALLLAEVWEPVGKALNAAGGRVNFVANGRWVSPQGKIVVEHGHQIGNEANRYETWPDIVGRQNGQEYIIRPWGERFVQKFFNEQENDYPIIDNLSPESAGVWYRLKDLHHIPGNAADLARFVAFNLFQTSLGQKGQLLGAEPAPQAKPEWDISEARKLGHRLFLAALPQDDPVRTLLLGNTEQAKETIRALDNLALDAKRLPDNDVKMLCDQAVIRNHPVCAKPELGAIVQQALVPRARIFASYLIQRQKEFPRMRYFVYGHTHLLETAWQPEGVSYTQILNSGAFQRVIGAEEFMKRVKQKGISPAEGLRKIDLGEIPPCYTFIAVPHDEAGNPQPKVLRWVMRESDTYGRVVSAGDEACE
jgi:UDP-2,3-diacylglucosamine pyrophosphatase LpxH